MPFVFLLSLYLESPWCQSESLNWQYYVLIFSTKGLRFKKFLSYISFGNIFGIILISDESESAYFIKHKSFWRAEKTVRLSLEKSDQNKYTRFAIGGIFNEDFSEVTTNLKNFVWFMCLSLLYL